MSDNKVLNICTNYQDIINCDFLEDDKLTSKIINNYQQYIFRVDLEKDGKQVFLKNLDNALKKYLEDYIFAKSFKETLDVNQIINKNFKDFDALFEYFEEFYRQYESSELPVPTPTKWL